jgi:tripartite ATP-independent transporter DctP family solute receptor
VNSTIKAGTSVTSGALKRRDLLRSGLLFGAGLAGVDLLAPSKASAQTVTMRLGSDSPMADEHNVGFVKLKEEVESKTNGRIKVVIFPDAQLGSNEAMNNAMKAGTLDGVMTDVASLSVAVPEMDIFSLPFLFTNTAHVLRAANGSVGSKLKPKIEEAFKCAVLGWGTDGSRNMWNSKRPIRTPDDLKGLKMRVQSSPIQKDTYAAFGALPTPIAFGELYTALQTGVVDGADPSVVDMLSLKFYQVTKYLTLTNHFSIINILAVGQAFLSKLSPADQEIVRQAGKRGAEAQAKATLDAEASGLTDLKTKGIQVFEMADPKAFVAKVEPVYAADADKVGGKALIEEARTTT